MRRMKKIICMVTILLQNVKRKHLLYWKAELEMIPMVMSGHYLCSKRMDAFITQIPIILNVEMKYLCGHIKCMIGILMRLLVDFIIHIPTIIIIMFLTQVK